MESLLYDGPEHKDSGTYAPLFTSVSLDALNEKSSTAVRSLSATTALSVGLLILAEPWPNG